MRRALFALLVGLLPVLPAAISPARAQVNPFGDSPNSPFSAGDFEVMTEAAEHLFAETAMTPGASRTWQNPKTGVSGTVGVVSNFTTKGWSCAVVLYQATPRGLPPLKGSTLNWCNTPHGWKII